MTWDSFDGLKTVLYGHFSAGISGHSLVHSDTGGYTMLDILNLKYDRSKELLLRWIEMNTFTNSMLRTHPGSNPEKSA